MCGTHYGVRRHHSPHIVCGRNVSISRVESLSLTYAMRLRQYIPCTCAALPQLDRGSDYESERHRFESCTPHHLKLKAGSFGSQPFFVYRSFLQYAATCAPPSTPLRLSLTVNRTGPQCRPSQRWSTRGDLCHFTGYNCLNVHNCAFSQKRARSVGEAWRR